jgi:hypothetical protein
MSFIDTQLKPQLVETKIINKIMKIQQEEITWISKYSSKIWEFIINNIGILIFFVVIIILLCYRYYDVKNKKEKQYNIEDYIIE